MSLKIYQRSDKLLSNMTVIIAIQRGARGSSAKLTSNHVKKEKAISIAGKISRCYNTIMLPRTWQDYSRAFARGLQRPLI